MNTLNILSGGAAQGLVRDSAAFRAQTGRHRRRVRRGRVMAEKLRKGTPTDLVILTMAIVAKLAAEKLVAASSRSGMSASIGCLAVRAGDPQIAVKDGAGLREHCWRRMRSSYRYQGIDGGASRRKVLEQLGVTDESPGKIFPNGATAMRELAKSDARRPIGCTQSTEIISTNGVMLSGSLPPGCELATMYTAAVATGAAAAQQAQRLIDLLTAADASGLRSGAGFVSGPG